MYHLVLHCEIASALWSAIFKSSWVSLDFGLYLEE
jgi:hypothetical protein